MILELLQQHRDGGGYGSVLFFCRKKSFLDLIDRCKKERIEIWSNNIGSPLMRLKYEDIKENFFQDFEGMIDECLIVLTMQPGLSRSCFIKTRFTTYTLENGWDKLHMVDYLEFIRDNKIDEILK